MLCNPEMFILWVQSLHASGWVTFMNETGSGHPGLIEYPDPAAAQFRLWATPTYQDHVFLSVGIHRAWLCANPSVDVCKLTWSHAH